MSQGYGNPTPIQISPAAAPLFLYGPSQDGGTGLLQQIYGNLSGTLQGASEAGQAIQFGNVAQNAAGPASVAPQASSGSSLGFFSIGNALSYLNPLKAGAAAGNAVAADTSQAQTPPGAPATIPTWLYWAGIAIVGVVGVILLIDLLRGVEEAV